MTNHDEMKKQKEEVNDMCDSDEEEYEEETIKLDEEIVHCDHSSFITDKYMEDLSAKTVANTFSDMILSFEQSAVAEEIFNPDPEEAFYVEDEIYISDEEFEDEVDIPENSSLSEEEIDV